jgi:arylsulfate sulfotransferase
MRNTLTSLILVLLVSFTACKKEDRSAIMNNPTEGEMVLSTFNIPTPGKLMRLDKNGKVLWEKNMPVAAINFQKWQVAGKTRYTYMEFDQSGAAPPQGIWPTTGVLLNENYQEIKRVRLLPFNGRTASEPNTLDGHDLIYLDDNHFITLAYFEKTVNNIPASLNPVPNCKVVAAIVQEIVNDQVVWEWDSSKYPELYLSSVEGNAFSNANVMHDYVHMNSLFIDPTDNNLICSNRNSNQVIKISRTDGRIIWRLGGTDSDFPLSANLKFLRQHHATLTDNNQTLLLFDNGHATERPYSRVMEFQLNQEAKSITSSKVYNLPQNIFAQFMASVQKRGDTYFISTGSDKKVLEVNYKTDQITFLKELDNLNYKAYKY